MDQDDSPFSDHLRALLNRTRANAAYDLASVLKRIIREGHAPEQTAVQRLIAAGLVRNDGQRIVPANGLYARFFERTL